MTSGTVTFPLVPEPIEQTWLSISVQKKFGLASPAPLEAISLHRLCQLNALEVSTVYDEAAAIRDILEGRVRKSFPTNRTYLHREVDEEKYGYPAIAYKTQSGTIDDLFDDKSANSCTLHPTGAKKFAAALQVTDQAMATLVALPEGAEDPVGIAYCLLGVTLTGRRVLLVDCIDGGNLPYGWCRDFYGALQDFALDTRRDSLIFDTRALTTKPVPNQFGEFLLAECVKRRQLSRTLSLVAKSPSTAGKVRYKTNRQYFESFLFQSPWGYPAGLVNGYQLDFPQTPAQRVAGFFHVVFPTR